MSWHGCSAAKSTHQQELDDQEFRATLEAFEEMTRRAPPHWRIWEIRGDAWRIVLPEGVVILGNEAGKSVLMLAVNEALTEAFSRYYKTEVRVDGWRPIRIALGPSMSLTNSE